MALTAQLIVLRLKERRFSSKDTINVDSTLTYALFGRQKRPCKKKQHEAQIFEPDFELDNTKRTSLMNLFEKKAKATLVSTQDISYKDYNLTAKSVGHMMYRTSSKLRLTGPTARELIIW